MRMHFLPGCKVWRILYTQSILKRNQIYVYNIPYICIKKACACTYIYVHLHTHTHTHTHTHAFFFFLLLRGTHAAYGSSQARSQIIYSRCLCHSHSNAVSKPRLRPRPQLRAMPWILDPLREARDGTQNLLVPSRIRFWCTTTGIPGMFLFREKRRKNTYTFQLSNRKKKNKQTKPYIQLASFSQKLSN